MSETDGIDSAIKVCVACAFRSGGCLRKQAVALYSREGAEITATEHFLWNSSKRSLETQLLKPLAYLPSQNDTTTPPRDEAPPPPPTDKRGA